jgi:hypothetical protein
VTVTIEQTPTMIQGKFSDEIMAARAHDLLVLLFCTGRASRRVNFQAWTYADELVRYRHLSMVCKARPCKHWQDIVQVTVSEHVLE